MILEDGERSHTPYAGTLSRPEGVAPFLGTRVQSVVRVEPQPPCVVLPDSKAVRNVSLVWWWFVSDFCDFMDLPGSSVHEISQARILEWVAVSFSRVSSPFRGRTWLD